MTKKRRKPRGSKLKHRPNTGNGRTIVAGFSVPIPSELRLLPSVDASGLRAIEEKVNMMQGELARLRVNAQSPQKIEVVPPQVTVTLISVATNVWRARNKMLDTSTGEPKDEMRRVYRHIEGIFNAFDELGLKTIDPTGQAYDSGMALIAISFEETPGLSREEITETMKPSVTWQGRLLQKGEVIVGTPIQEKTTDTEESDEQKHD